MMATVSARWRAGLDRSRVGLNRLVDYRHRIGSAEAWDGLAHRLDTSSTARTSTVKFLIDLERDELIFMNSGRWPLHHDFVRRFIDPARDLDEFNRTEYTSDDRRFVLGSVLHYGDGDLWTVEFDVSDTLPADRVRETFERVAASLHRGTELRLRPRSEHLERVAAELAPGISSIGGDSVNATVRYQPVVTGVAFGHVRCVTGPVDPSSFSPTDIVVLDHVPAEIPPVAALVTGELQAPLAHVAVLCRNRDTPDMALRDATDHDDVRELDGRLARLSIGQQDFHLAPATEHEARAAWESIRPPRPAIPTRDLDVDQPVDLDRLRPDDASFAGSKAARLAEISALPGVRTTGGFVVPFAWYERHLDRAGVRPAIAAVSSDPDLDTDANSTRLALVAEIRDRVMATPVDGSLLDDVMARLPTMPCIMRSSTNAEDLDGFNGAGLYDSIVVDDPGDRDAVDRTLRSVWASVWSARGVEEREWYRIDHAAVSMAVLVQPVVPAMDAIGVAVTHNPFNTGLTGHFVNVQRGSASVTDAVGDELPEQILIHTWGPSPEVEVLSRATGLAGEAIMSESELVELSEVLTTIESAIVPPGSTSTAADVEFALGGGDDRIVVLQARPYRVGSDDERTLWTSELGALRRLEWNLRPRLDRLVRRLRRPASPR